MSQLSLEGRDGAQYDSPLLFGNILQFLVLIWKSGGCCEIRYKLTRSSSIKTSGANQIHCISQSPVRRNSPSGPAFSVADPLNIPSQLRPNLIHAISHAESIEETLPPLTHLAEIMLPLTFVTAAPLLLRRFHYTTRHVSMTAAPKPSAQPNVAPKPTERKQRVLSGVQPTGALHLGNYLGAIRQWTHNQDKYDNLFVVVDLHAITVPHDRKALPRDTLQSVAMYLACGIDPARSKVFVQSHVSAHAELTWLLNCSTPMGWVERMIQFKEKARRQGENVSVALFDYPVLMAADILLYQTDLVPVGEDQRQHIELARDIARRYNELYCKKKRPRTLREPKALMQTSGARVMSLDDGKNKMSKSAENDMSRINLTDTPQTITRKVKRCKTDSFEGLQFDIEDRPECNNLLSIYQLVTNRSKEEVQKECDDMRWGTFKPLLGEAIVEHLRPIQEKYKELLDDRTYLSSVLKDGYQHASADAATTLDAIKRDMGFVLRSDLGF